MGKNKIFRSMLLAFSFLVLPMLSTCPTVAGKLSILAFMAKVANKSNHNQNDQNFHCWWTWSKWPRKIVRYPQKSLLTVKCQVASLWTSDIFSQPFCPRLQTVKVLVFLGHFWPRFFFFCLSEFFFYPLLVRLDIGTGVEQLIGCLVVQNCKAM